MLFLVPLVTCLVNQSIPWLVKSNTGQMSISWNLDWVSAKGLLKSKVLLHAGTGPLNTSLDNLSRGRLPLTSLSPDQKGWCYEHKGVSCLKHLSLNWPECTSHLRQLQDTTQYTIQNRTRHSEIADFSWHSPTCFPQVTGQVICSPVRGPQVSELA